MYGGSGKLSRGGGGGPGPGGGNKRNIHSTFHPPPLLHHRPASAAAAPGGRLSMGGAGTASRNRVTSASAAPATSSTSAATEESFSLVTGNPLNFAMIIRLAPDLVEEIKRVESQGNMARIKFDANTGRDSFLRVIFSKRKDTTGSANSAIKRWLVSMLTVIWDSPLPP